MQLPRLILASQSPRRIELLRQITFHFEVIPSVVEEVQSEHLTARETAQLNAYRKARVVAKRFPDALVLGSDTVVELDNTLFGKPESLEEARTMLLQLQGKTHQVVTGVCLIHLRGHRQKLYAESTGVTFRRLTGVEIDRYLEKVNPLDKAGGYAIQEYGESIVQDIEGSYTNVMGLPVESLRTELVSWGLSP
ncbi:MAG: Maf family protein [Verrucomicrobia bacterium]|jgi:septum formation protein|nr:Maf family protein [Verrucomicrobiota bacterium]